MATRIFFCGEIVADMLERQQGSGRFELLLGGSQFHGAMGAARAIGCEGLDIQAGFVGPISKDMFGERFWQALRDAGVDLQGVRRVDRQTTLAVVSICPGKENAFAFYGRDTAEQMTRTEDLPHALGGSDRKICCFGSISTVMEPARFAWLEFAERQRTSSLVMYDLNTRPAIARDPERYRGIVLEWARVAHVMKASDADIGWAYPGMSMKDVAALWRDAGAPLAVFTKGAQGAEAYTKDGCVSAATAGLIVSNTVGAGDNFNAGLAIHFAKAGVTAPDAVHRLTEVQLKDILHGANRTAAAHLMSLGAQSASSSPPSGRGRSA